MKIAPPLFSIAILLATIGSLTAAESSETPTHEEIDPIKIELGKNGKIETMAMDSDGRLLLGVSWGESPDTGLQRASPRGNGPNEKVAGRSYTIRVVTPDGKIAKSIDLKSPPKMIHGAANGDIYVCGGGSITQFDSAGKVLQSLAFSSLGKEYEDAHASGITVNKSSVFVALGFGFSLRATEDIARLDRDLKNGKVIVTRQYGCCSHIDLETDGDVLLIAENSRHRVNRYDATGKLLSTWGRRDRSGIEGFAACCNPVNFDTGPGGDLYTAESGIGRVKRYTPAGKFLGLVGYVDTTKFDRGSRLAAMSCYIPVEVSADGDRVYIMDVRANYIRVLARKTP